MEAEKPGISLHRLSTTEENTDLQAIDFIFIMLMNFQDDGSKIPQAFPGLLLYSKYTCGGSLQRLYACN